MHLISRDTLKKKVSGYIKAYKPNPATIRLLDWLMNIVDNLPVIEERKQGRYKKKDCTECGYPMPTDSYLDYIVESEIHYCYHCGAEMSGVKNDIKS